MNSIQRAVFSILILMLPTAAWSATAFIGASRDNTIYQNSVSSSAGGAAGIFVGTNGQGSPRRGLIAFDVVGSVPTGATITSAQFSMYLGAQSNTNGQTVSLHRLTTDWGEGAAGSSSLAIGGGGNGFAASAGDATWSERFLASSAWTSPGAAGDFNSVASASAVVGGPLDEPHTWASTAALVGDVQNWLNSPASNFGWALVNGNETASQTVKVFYSRSATLNSVGGTLVAAWRPTLTVTYVIPEPAAVILLLLAAPLVFACRRRCV